MEPSDVMNYYYKGRWLIVKINEGLSIITQVTYDGTGVGQI